MKALRSFVMFFYHVPFSTRNISFLLIGVPQPHAGGYRCSIPHPIRETTLVFVSWSLTISPYSEYCHGNSHVLQCSPHFHSPLSEMKSNTYTHKYTHTLWTWNIREKDFNAVKFWYLIQKEKNLFGPQVCIKTEIRRFDQGLHSHLLHHHHDQHTAGGVKTRVWSQRFPQIFRVKSESLVKLGIFEVASKKTCSLPSLFWISYVYQLAIKILWMWGTVHSNKKINLLFENPPYVAALKFITP